VSSADQGPTVELVRRQLLKHATAIFEIEVGPEHGFLSLGGDSVHALELLFRVEEDLGVELDPLVLYETATFAELADVIVARASGGDW
jgi:acyl carrier protein